MLIEKLSHDLTQHTYSLPDKLTVKPSRIGHRLKKNIDYIEAISVTTDGSTLALISNDLVVVYDVLNEKEIMRYKTPRGKPSALHISSSGKYMAIGTSIGGVILYDIKDRKVIGTQKNSNFIIDCVHISEDINLIASANFHEFFIYSLDYGRLTNRFEFKYRIGSVWVNSRDNHLILQSADCSEIRDMKTGNLVARLTLHEMEGPYQIPAQKYIILNSGNEVLLGNLFSREIKRFKHPQRVRASKMTPKDECLVTACIDGKIRVFKGHTQEPVKVFRHPESVAPTITLAISNKWVFSGDDMVRVWDKETGEQIYQFHGHSSAMITACLSRDGRRFYAGGYDGTLKSYDLHTCRPVQRFERHFAWVSSVAIDEEHNLVATGSHDSTVKLFSLSGKLLYTLRGHQDGVHSVAIHPNGKMIVTGARDNMIMLWDRESGTFIRGWNAHAGWVRSVTFDSSGTRVLSGGDDGIVRLWTLDGRCVQEYGFHSRTVYSALFSPDEKMLVTCSEDATFKLYDVHGHFIKVFRGHKMGVREVLFLSDGTLISGSLDVTAKRWDIKTGKCIQTYNGSHTDWIRCICAKDSLLIMGSKDGTISFNDIESGKHLASLINVDKGFLWTTPPDDGIAKSGWFFTNREDLIEVVEVDSKGKVKVIDQDSQASRNYMSTYNSVLQITNRLNNGSDNKIFENFLMLHSDIHKKQETYKLLQNPGSDD